jgi:hypothetical protein
MNEFDYRGEGAPYMGKYLESEAPADSPDVEKVSLEQIRAGVPAHYASVVLARLPNICPNRPFDQHRLTVLVNETGRIIGVEQG